MRYSCSQLTQSFDTMTTYTLFIPLILQANIYIFYIHVALLPSTTVEHCVVWYPHYVYNRETFPR